ncbi:MAG: hypothetical protein H0T73_16795 [Ardenticatenales bacterium]|nr:hypothetical protein [Ardenticatenales bacterium]
MAPLVREYGQSQAMTDFAHTLGLHIAVVPGYEQREARRAALLARRSAFQAGQSLFMAADGHRAPAHAIAENPLWLAPAADVPLLPLALAARPALTLPTWDRKQLPFLRSRVGVAIGPPLHGTATAEELRARLEALAIQAATLAHEAAL